MAERVGLSPNSLIFLSFLDAAACSPSSDYIGCYTLSITIARLNQFEIEDWLGLRCKGLPLGLL